MRLRSLSVVLIVGLMFALCPAALAAESRSAAAAPPRAYTKGSESFDEGLIREQLLFGFAITHGLLTRVQFQIGRTKAYGRYAYEPEHPYGWNNGGVAELEAESGRLRPDTTYHYRLVAWNEAGKSFGIDRTFHTRPRKQSPGH